MYKLKHIRRSTWAAVSQFEGQTCDGRPVHVRYRWGELSVRVGPVGGDIDAALETAPVLQTEHGDEKAFDISWTEVARLTGIEVVGKVTDPYDDEVRAA